MSRALPDVAAVRGRLAHRPSTVPVMMRAVLIALLPGTLLQALWLGAGVLVNVALAVTACLLVEAAMLRLRRRPVGATLADGSAALAGWLLALCVTPALPAWQLLLGCAVAIALAKHVFGGIGHNPFNPAMVGYAVLLVSFPATMNAWPAAMGVDIAPRTAADTARPAEPPSATWQAISGQTPLSAWQAVRRDEVVVQERDSDTGVQAWPQPAAIAVSLAWLAGGLWLLWRGVITWHIPVALLGTLAALDLIALLASATTPGPALTLLSGSAMFAAFFIATDPVSAAASRRGRLVYAAGIGAITFAIRQGGGWPDGIAFAVLLMNGAVPLIDRLSARRVR